MFLLVGFVDDVAIGSTIEEVLLLLIFPDRLLMTLN